MKPAFRNTTRTESFKSWRFRTLIKPNAARWYPMYFGTGGKILFWSGDFATSRTNGIMNNARVWCGIPISNNHDFTGNAQS